MKDKYGVEDEAEVKDTKTAKAVKILKAVFKATKKMVKWSSENLTVGKVVKGGMIRLVVGTLVKAAIFG